LAILHSETPISKKQTKIKEGEGEGWGGKRERGGQRGREEGGGGKRGDWHTLRAACEHNFKVRRRSSAAHTSRISQSAPILFLYLYIYHPHQNLCSSELETVLLI
jgi:hypothetical protein